MNIRIGMQLALGFAVSSVLIVVVAALGDRPFGFGFTFGRVVL